MTDPFTLERERQTQELCEALDKVINDFGAAVVASGRVPMLNAVAGALVTIQGTVLASVDDARIRKNLRREMEKLLPRAIAAASGGAVKTQVHYMTDKRQ